MKLKNNKIRFSIISIFPDIFDCYLKESVLGRARRKGLVDINIFDLRDFSEDKHRRVDDRAFGGGPGMVLKIEPIYKAVEKLKAKNKKLKRKRVVLLSVRGKKFSNKEAKRLSKYNELILICGRYEGVDERVAKYVADEEISVGDYVLTGGELAALVVIDVISRQIPGVLGKKESLEEVKGFYPVYTRPEVFEMKRRRKDEVGRGVKKIKVPKILLSGDHKKIKEWRNKHGRRNLDFKSFL